MRESVVIIANRLNTASTHKALKEPRLYSSARKILPCLSQTLQFKGNIFIKNIKVLILNKLLYYSNVY